MRWFRSRLDKLYYSVVDVGIACIDSVKTRYARLRYPHSVPIHIVGITEYSMHYEWLAENVVDHTNSVWATFDTQLDMSNYPPAIVSHYVGEFRFKRKSDAVNYWLRFN